jgi:hypothetical protein
MIYTIFKATSTCVALCQTFENFAELGFNYWGCKNLIISV